MFRHRFKISELFLAVLLLALFLCSCGSAAKKQGRPGVSAGLPTGTPVGSQKSHAGLTDADKAEIVSRMTKIHIPFIANEGQTDGRVKFYAHTFGGTVFVTGDGEIVYSLPRRSEKEKTLKGLALKERLVGAWVKKVTGKGQAATRVSYFKGKDRLRWRSNIPTYRLVDLGEVYKGIGLKLKAHGNNVEKLFSVKPGARPETIKVGMAGAKALKRKQTGELEVETRLGTVRFMKPLAYQDQGGQRKYVEVAYAVEGDRYGFTVGDYDRDNVLTIDPFVASTFVGEGNLYYGVSIALDASGNVYVAGNTPSPYFPTTTGAYDETHGGLSDAFVSKLDSELTTLIASTFLGGSDSDVGITIALDASGNVYVTGYTESEDFPTTAGAYDETHNQFSDGFVSKLDSDLTTLTASTFLGGSKKKGKGGHDYPFFLALDATGNVYVAGHTDSSDFPTTTGAYDETHNGLSDAFVSKLDSDLANLTASTFLGGAINDGVYPITLDTNGNVLAAGITSSPDFPTTAGAYNQIYSSGDDAFVSKLDSGLATLVSSTFLGGSLDDCIVFITSDASGNVYVTGYTESPDFPTTMGAYDETHNGGVYDAFISRLDTDLANLAASTFLGGNGYDVGVPIALDASGNVYVAGFTESGDFPTTPNAYDQSHNGGFFDAFVSRLDSNLANLTASTFRGGTLDDIISSIALAASGNLYVAGITSSPDFPTTTGAYNQTHSGGNDAFISKLSASLSIGFALTVSKDGTATGTVTGIGIDCGSDCSELYTEGTVVTLTAAADPGSAFVGWSGGGCSGLGDCILTMAEDTSVTATFDLDSDGDGLPDWWELDNFGNLDQTADGDPDRDGLTNLQEHLIGSYPDEYDTDNDDDGLPDSCELNYFGNLSEVQERNGDYDADGVTNNMECEIGTDPGDASDRRDPGYHYKYNASGRLKKVYVVPGP